MFKQISFAHFLIFLCAMKNVHSFLSSLKHCLFIFSVVIRSLLKVFFLQIFINYQTTSLTLECLLVPLLKSGQ